MDDPAQTFRLTSAAIASFCFSRHHQKVPEPGRPPVRPPTDAGHNNVYDVTVQVSDGAGGIDTQALSVSVQNVSDPNADILWQNSVVGTPALWLMDGLSATDVAGLPNLGADWHVIA